MDLLPAWAVALSGGMIGFAVGYAAKRGRLCTFGAFEDAFISGNFRRLKTLAVALGIAILLTNGMIVKGWLDPQTIRYLPPALPWLSIAIGGLLFGIGMALAGTCAFGSLVRLGGGDLRSLVVIMIFAGTALMVLRGVLAPARLAYVETQAVDMPGGVQSSFASLAEWATRFDLGFPLAIALSASLLIWAFASREILQTPRLLRSGVVLGLGVGAGWLVTGVFADSMEVIRSAVSLTFVAPVADVLHVLAVPGSRLIDFGLASVAGVVIGSAFAAMAYDEFRWEAYDDHHEMRRHIAGAILMGAGGVLAGGCTIGQGMTAGSVLAISWPIAVGGMAIGARIGFFYLMEGSMSAALKGLKRGLARTNG